jgi:hypothetical protein
MLTADLFSVIGSMRVRSLPLDPLSVAVELEGVAAPSWVRGRLEVLGRQVTAFGVIEHRVRIVLTAAAGWREVQS